MICYGGPCDGYDFGDSCPVESDGFRYIGPVRDFRYEPIGDALFYAGTIAEPVRTTRRSGCVDYFLRLFKKGQIS